MQTQTITHRFLYDELDRVLQKQGAIVKNFQRLYRSKHCLTDIPRVIGVYQTPRILPVKNLAAEAKHQEYFKCDEQIDESLISILYNPADFVTENLPEEISEQWSLQDLIDLRNPSERVRCFDASKVSDLSYFTRKPVFRSTYLHRLFQDMEKDVLDLDQGMKKLQEEKAYFDFAKENFGLTLAESVNLETLKRILGYYQAVSQRK